MQSFFGLAGPTGIEPCTSPEEPERDALEPMLIRGAAWVTGGSSDEVDRLAALRRNRARLSLLAAGVDVRRFAPITHERPGDGPFRIVQLEPNPLPCNGLDRIIRILPGLADTELMIATKAAGDYQVRYAELHRLAAQHGVSDRVSFVQNADTEQVLSLLQSADVVACTARQATRTTTTLQAMASGRAVVGVQAGALADCVIDGVTGVLVSPTKPRELLGALKALHAQPFQRASLGSAGRSRAASRYSWDRIAKDTLHIYQQATARHSTTQSIGADLLVT